VDILSGLWITAARTVFQDSRSDNISEKLSKEPLRRITQKNRSEELLRRITQKNRPEELLRRIVQTDRPETVFR
jgi:hypothetical protein